MYPTNIFTASIVLIGLFALEGLIPHYPGRTARLRHAAPHILAALLNGIIKWGFLSGITLGAIAWREGRSPGLAHWLPMAYMARTAAVLVLFDLWVFFWHRANHHIVFLQRFHRAHHSDTAMDSTTALRFHPGELVLSAFIRLPVILLLGMSFAQLALYELILNLSVLFHHSNLALPEGWDRALRAVIVTPDMHRVHHSVEPDETNSNFSSILSVWDRLFKTFRMRDTHTIILGLPVFREEKWQGFRGFLITPAQ